MTIAPISIIWPIRSRNSSFMCSGLMNDERDRQERRQRQQHVAGEAAVRGVHAHLPQDLEPLAHDVREVVENLRQVAAGLALNQHGGDEEPDVEHADALGQLVERVAQRQAVVLLIEGLLELRARPAPAARRPTMPMRRLKRVSGADGARQQVERFGELLFEALQPRWRACASGRRTAATRRPARRPRAPRTPVGTNRAGEQPDAARRRPALIRTIALGVVWTPDCSIRRASLIPPRRPRRADRAPAAALRRRA